LDEIQLALSRMLVEYPDQVDFLNAFAGETEVLEEQAGH